MAFLRPSRWVVAASRRRPPLLRIRRGRKRGPLLQRARAPRVLCSVPALHTSCRRSQKLRARQTWRRRQWRRSAPRCRGCASGTREGWRHPQLPFPRARRLSRRRRREEAPTLGRPQSARRLLVRCREAALRQGQVLHSARDLRSLARVRPSGHQEHRARRRRPQVACLLPGQGVLFSRAGRPSLRQPQAAAVPATQHGVPRRRSRPSRDQRGRSRQERQGPAVAVAARDHHSDLDRSHPRGSQSPRRRKPLPSCARHCLPS